MRASEWLPIETLKEYDSKEISFIAIKGKNLDDNTEFLMNLSGDILEITDDKNIYFNDFDRGIIEYNEAESCYEHWYYQHKTRYDITEISFEYQDD